MESLATVLQLAPGGKKLPPGASLVDVASWPFFFYFQEGKIILDSLELEQHVLERLEVC